MRVELGLWFVSFKFIGTFAVQVPDREICWTMVSTHSPVHSHQIVCESKNRDNTVLLARQTQTWTRGFPWLRSWDDDFLVAIDTSDDKILSEKYSWQSISAAALWPKKCSRKSPDGDFETLRSVIINVEVKTETKYRPLCSSGHTIIPENDTESLLKVK